MWEIKKDYLQAIWYRFWCHFYWKDIKGETQTIQPGKKKYEVWPHKEKITEKQETIASLNTEISSIQKAIEEQKNTLKEK